LILGRRRKERTVKRKTKYIFGGVVALGAICTICLAIRFVGGRIACGAEEKLKVVELSGVRFEVTYLSCDTLAKDEAIRVYAETTAAEGAWFFPNQRKHRTLLFRYDPMRVDSPLPTITRPSQSTILISIPEVSEINYQNRKWENISIDYAVGRVEYPPATK